MSIEQTDRIDAIGIDKVTGEVVLTISDHLPWIPSTTRRHLEVLQEKLNTYLAFVETQELLERYPNAVGRSVLISIVGQHEMSPEGADFLGVVAETVKAAGVSVKFERFSEQ